MSQCLEALKVANNIRTIRANLKREIAAGTVSAAEVIRSEHDPDWRREMKVGEIIGAIPGYGVTKTHDLTSIVDAYPTQPLARLTPRQRRLLAHILEAQARRRKSTEEVAA